MFDTGVTLRKISAFKQIRAVSPSFSSLFMQAILESFKMRFKRKLIPKMSAYLTIIPPPLPPQTPIAPSTRHLPSRQFLNIPALLSPKPFLEIPALAFQIEKFQITYVCPTLYTVLLHHQRKRQNGTVQEKFSFPLKLTAKSLLHKLSEHLSSISFLDFVKSNEVNSIFAIHFELFSKPFSLYFLAGIGENRSASI